MASEDGCPFFLRSEREDGCPREGSVELLPSLGAGGGQLLPRLRDGQNMAMGATWSLCLVGNGVAKDL